MTNEKKCDIIGLEKLNEGGGTVYNYSKLLGRLKEKGVTQEQLSRLIGKTEATVSLKINGRAFFTQREIDTICVVLDIPDAEIKDYFFTKQVQKN